MTKFSVGDENLYRRKCLPTNAGELNKRAEPLKSYQYLTPFAAIWYLGGAVTNAWGKMKNCKYDRTIKLFTPRFVQIPNFNIFFQLFEESSTFFSIVCNFGPGYRYGKFGDSPNIRTSQSLFTGKLGLPQS